MANPSQSLSRDIAAEPTRVWSVLTDLENAPEILSSVSKVEVLTDGPYRVGTKWRETRSTLGRQETSEMEVTELEALGLVRIEGTSDDSHQVTTIKLQALHPGTRLTMSADSDTSTGEHQGTLAKLAKKVLAPVQGQSTNKALQSDLDDIAKAAESARR